MKPIEMPAKHTLLYSSALIVIGMVIFLALVWGGSAGTPPVTGDAQFEGEKAYQDVVTQVETGPRTIGSEAHQKTVDWIQTELKAAGWSVTIQEITYQGQPVQNIIAKKGSGDHWDVVGAHYDSRLVADQDPDPNKRQQAVPGANDGASGVGVLLELARSLPEDLDKQVWLVFFDTEDNGNIPGYDWILGSRAFVEQLESKPDRALIVDMIGDADLNIYMERNSDEVINNHIWEIAKNLGYDRQFIPSYKYSMLDDHTPFLEAGIPAADIIDFDYPYWHTTSDTVDKVSVASLDAVGDTVLQWLIDP
ncbi:MAG TPA: M28 family peptidase [Anaerolineaceae bacterium]|nr:M28 family peptidase [Anaerolineaceae bacterium]